MNDPDAINSRIEQLIKKLHENPTDTKLPLQIAACLNKSGRMHESGEYYGIAVQASPDDITLHRKHINAWDIAENGENAVRAAMAALEQKGADNKLEIQVFNILTKYKHWEEAVALASMFAEKYPNDISLLKRCIASLRNSEATVDVEALESIFKIRTIDNLISEFQANPTDTKLPLQIAVCLNKSGRLHESGEYYGIAVQASPDDITLHRKHINAWDIAENGENAVRAAMAALEQKGADNKLELQIFNILTKYKRWEEAVALASMFAEKYPNDISLLKRCIASLRNGGATVDVEALESNLTIRTIDNLISEFQANPTDTKLPLQIASLLLKSGRQQKAAEYLRIASLANPDDINLHNRHISTWIKLIKSGTEEERIATAIVVMNHDLGDPKLDKLIFETLELSQCWEEAVPLAIKLAQKYPGDYSFVGRCLSILRAAGNDKEACEISSSYIEARGKRPIHELWEEHLAYMTHYYDGGHLMTWVPYVMLAPPANFSTPVYTTDARGFRYSTSGGVRFSPADDAQKLANMALVGGSTVFGVGSSSDGETVASHLSRDGRYCYNLGTRAAVIQQNTVQFLFELDTFSNLDHIAILSGWNELAVIHRSKIFPKLYGPFFSWNAYCRQLNPIIGNFPEEDWPAPMRAHMSMPSDRDGQPAIGEMFDVLERMLLAWKVMSAHSGAELTYILQPNADWTKRQAPTEEVELLNALAEVAGTEAQEQLEFMADKHDWYADELQKICDRHSIRFIDANKLIEKHPDRDQWLFADPAHLTDTGARILAEILTKEFQHV